MKLLSYLLYRCRPLPENMLSLTILVSKGQGRRDTHADLIEMWGGLKKILEPRLLSPTAQTESFFGVCRVHVSSAEAFTYEPTIT